MKVEQLLHPLFESCDLPAVFIDEYLPSLSGDAVRLYLLLLRAMRRGETPEPEGLAARLRLDLNRLAGLFDELEKQGLLQREGEGICRLTDLQNKVLEHRYRRRTSSSPTDRPDSRRAGGNSAREALVNSISNTYFNGMLSANWYNLINELIDDCGFDLPVVYSLFSICAARNKLNQSYVRSVAADWHRQRVVTQADLNRLNRAWEERRHLSYQVGRLMNRRMTKPDEAEVEGWVERYGYGLDMIEAAIARTKGIESPNLNYVAKVLESWHRAGLKTPAEIAAYEEERRQSAVSRSRHGGSGADRRGQNDNVGNFEERQYSEDYWDSLAGGPSSLAALDQMLALNQETKKKQQAAEGEAPGSKNRA